MDFSVEQAMQVSVGNCGMEEYKAFYLASYRAIKAVLPDARVLGFGLDTGFVALPEHHEFEELLLFSKEHGCVPDILGFQCFFVTIQNPAATKELILTIQKMRSTLCQKMKIYYPKN